MNEIDSILQAALLHHRTGSLKIAEDLYRRILQMDPNHSDALHFLGLIAHQSGDHARAAGLIQKAIANKPDVPHFYYNLGLVFTGLKQPISAIRAFQKTVQLAPDYAEAYYNLALAQKDQGQYEAAIANFKSALQLNPKFYDAYYNLANVLHSQDRLPEAIDNYRYALQLKPDFAEGHNNLGLALREQGELPGAIANHTQAIRIRRDFAEAHWNRALDLIMAGDYARGWREYEWRFQRDVWQNKFQHARYMPRWDGSNFKGKSLLIHAEQGLGDTLQFIRYIPLVKARGGKVIFEENKLLHNLLDGFCGIDEIVDRNEGAEPAVVCDYYIPLLSLPAIFGTRQETIPADIPYLRANAELVRQWKRRLAGAPDFKIGICWQGNPSYKADHRRSIALKHFIKIARLQGVQLFSLQKKHGMEQLAQLPTDISIIDLGSQLDESTGAFMDTAAVMQIMDLIITSDTAIAHLAGALGVPLWLLLPCVPDWRWGLSGRTCSWYPTMQIYRQPQRGNWDEVFTTVADALTMRLAGKHPHNEPYHKTTNRVIAGNLVDARGRNGWIRNRFELNLKAQQGARQKMLKKIYRICDHRNGKTHLEGVTKKHCFVNFVKIFGSSDLIVIADNTGKETLEFLKYFSSDIHTTSLGNSKSFMYALDLAVNYSDKETVYLVEDDYLHLEGAEKILLEGVQRADYVSLYDNPDKYIDAGQNPFVSDGGEDTKVILTGSTHWKYTNSTTMTFAAKVKTLRQDYEIIKQHCLLDRPLDFRMFLTLAQNGKKVITPIPARATHCDHLLSPLINWRAVAAARREERPKEPGFR